MRSSVARLGHTVVSFQQQQQLLLLVSGGTRGSPRAETQFPTAFPLLAALSQVCLLFPTSMPMFMPFLLPEVTFLLSPKALIQFLEASGPSWHGLQSKSWGGDFQKAPTHHSPPDLLPAAAKPPGPYLLEEPGGLATASPSQLAQLGYYSHFSGSFCPLRPSLQGHLSRFPAYQLPEAQETLPGEMVPVTPTHSVLGCFFPALSTKVMHSFFVSVFV